MMNRRDFFKFNTIGAITIASATIPVTYELIVALEIKPQRHWKLEFVRYVYQVPLLEWYALTRNKKRYDMGRPNPNTFST